MHDIKIVHAKDGTYDVYFDEQWTLSRSHPDNVFSFLERLQEPVIITFKDEFYV